MLKEIPLRPIDSVSVRGIDPLSPLKLPVALEIVNVPLPLMDSSDNRAAGMVNVPATVPAVKVMVKLMVELPLPCKALDGMGAVNVPLLVVEPIVRVADPASEKLVPDDIVSVALIVTEAVEEAAWAAAQISRMAKTRNVICPPQERPSSGLDPSELAKAIRAPQKV
jgi:hypothetical protein